MTEEIGLLLASSVGRSPETSAKLLARCQQGEIAAFEILYATHSARMKSIAFQMLGDRTDAEDAVQEAFLRIYRSCSSLEADSVLGAWMYRILLNCCHDVARKRERQAESAMQKEPAAPPAQIPLLQVALRRALARIHSGYRTVFWLFEAEGFRHSEIATILEIPEGTSRKWLFEAKRELQRLLKEARS